MSRKPEDERSRLIGELLRVLGHDGMEILARNRDAALRLVARCKGRKVDARLPDSDINDIEHHAERNLAAGRPGPIFVRWDFARDRTPMCRISDRGHLDVPSWRKAKKGDGQ